MMRSFHESMPELPEVETTRRGIAPHVIGKRITRVVVREPRLRWPVPDELSQLLTGERFSGIDRRAKYLLFKGTKGRLMIHLGMSGSLRISAMSSPPRKHDHIDIEFTDSTLLRYHDPRRFGSVFWLDGNTGHQLIDDLGPEPLARDFDGDYLYEKSRGRKVAVKLFIMNSRIVVGVGNIYANEALYLAGIRPDRSAGRISRERYAKLALQIKKVLDRAIESGGTTLRDFVKEDGSPGYFKQQLFVYDRGGQACHQCGRHLAEVRLSDRTTVFCRSCQR